MNEKITDVSIVGKLIDVSINVDELFNNEYFQHKLKEFVVDQQNKLDKQKPINNYKTLYKLEEVMNLTGLSRSSIYLQVKNKEFPQPIKMGKRAIRWEHDNIEDWMSTRIKAGYGENSERA